MMGTQEVSDTRQSGVVLLLQQFRAFFLSIDYHAAELIDIEWSAKASDTFLLVDDRSVMTTLDSDVADEEERGEEDEAYECCQEVKQPFDFLLESVHPIIYISRTLHESHISIFQVSSAGRLC